MLALSFINKTIKFKVRKPNKTTEVLVNMADPGSGTCVFMFKKRAAKGRGIRKRTNEPDSSNEDEAEEATVKVPRHKKVKVNPNIQHSSKRKPKDNEYLSSSDEDMSAINVNYKSSGSAMAAGPSDQGATATLEIETEKNQDAQAIFEKRLEINKQLEGQADDKVYRGINNYTQYFKPKDTAAGNASSGLVRRGPIRAPANLRATVRWDYQPDICKDYKETGFCGFGDSCKFLHDRGDYKHGWQLEREWEAGVYGKDSDDDKKYEIDSDADDLPDECGICKEEFKLPVITKCKHYFCEECALAQFRKSARCYLCNTQTNGVFNPAREIINKMNGTKKKKKEDDSSDDSSD